MVNDTPVPGMDSGRTGVHWLACVLLVTLSACGGNSSAPTATSSTPTVPTYSPATANKAALASTAAPAIVLSRADGTLRVQLDELANAPLVQDALNEGDETAWRQALPPDFAQHDHTETVGVCDGGDRISRLGDSGERNTVELRACVEGSAPTFLAGFSFMDDVAALERGLVPGISLATVLDALGIPEANATPEEKISSIEIVNAEHNNTLHLHFDDSGRLQQVTYEPYTG